MENNTVEKIKNIVDYMIEDGTEKTTYGNWIYYFEELVEKFDVYFEWIQERVDEFLEEIYNREEVAEVDYEDENNFSIYFYTDYCPNVEDKLEED